MYAAAVGAVLYALLGSSRQISTGPSSALAAVAAAAVVTSGVPSEDAPGVVAAVTLGSGLMFLALAAFRMGWVSRFLSKAVITGFLFGAAIEVVVGELSKITGSPGLGENAWRRLSNWIRHLDELDSTSLIIGLTAIASVLALRAVAPHVPGALVLVVGGLAASLLFDLPDRGVATVGDVPLGLPALELPSLELIGDHYQTIVVASLALLRRSPNRVHERSLRRVSGIGTYGRSSIGDASVARHRDTNRPIPDGVVFVGKRRSRGCSAHVIPTQRQTSVAPDPAGGSLTTLPGGSVVREQIACLAYRSTHVVGFRLDRSLAGGVFLL